MSVAQMIGLVLKLSVLATVFALGLNATHQDVAYLTHKPLLFARSLLAMYVVTPLVAVLLVRVVPAPLPVEIAVLLMAISIGAPALPKKLLKLGGSPRYVYSLAVFTALVAIVTVPVSLALLGPFLPRDAHVDVGQVAFVVLTGFLAPLVTGMAIRYAWPALAERIGEPIITTAGIVLLVVILLIVATSVAAIAAIGVTSLALIMAMTCASLAVGHFLGGPVPADRTTLAVACATRFPALGLLIASVNFPNAQPQPIVVAYLLISTVVAIPYLRWRKAQARRGIQLQPQATT